MSDPQPAAPEKAAPWRMTDEALASLFPSELAEPMFPADAVRHHEWLREQKARAIERAVEASIVIPMEVHRAELAEHGPGKCIEISRFTHDPAVTAEYVVVRKRDDSPLEAWTFDNLGDAARFYDDKAAQWNEVWITRVIVGPGPLGKARLQKILTAPIPSGVERERGADEKEAIIAAVLRGDLAKARAALEEKRWYRKRVVGDPQTPWLDELVWWVNAAQRLETAIVEGIVRKVNGESPSPQPEEAARTEDSFGALTDVFDEEGDVPPQSWLSPPDDLDALAKTVLGAARAVVDEGSAADLARERLLRLAAIRLSKYSRHCRRAR